MRLKSLKLRKDLKTIKIMGMIYVHKMHPF